MRLTNTLGLLALTGAGLLAGQTQAATIYAAEFNTDGDLEGYVDFGDRILGEAVAGGTLTGVVGGGNGDAQLRTGSDAAPLNLPLSDLTSAVVRFRSDAGNDGSFDDLTGNALSGFLFWGAVPYNGAAMGNVAGANIGVGAAASVVDDGGGWVIATWDLSSLSAPAQETDVPADLDSLRFDPTSGNGNGFEVDYIRIQGVPEPGSLALLGLGLAAVGRRRR